MPARPRVVRALVFHATPPGSETLSYQRGWPERLARDPRFDATLVNALDRRQTAALRLRRGLGRPDAVIVLHSVFSNECYLGGRLLGAIAQLTAPKVFFVGNEYKQMPEKVEFAEALGTDLLVSQFTNEAPLRLYRSRLSCAVVGIPNTGYDPDLFAPGPPLDRRPIDLGYRGYGSPWYLGHDERRQIAAAFAEAGARRGLVVDISLDPRDRLAGTAWAAFLQRCKGQVGSEAGGDFFELTDETRHAVNAYLADNPRASFDEVHARFFAHYDQPVSGRALSGRVVEAAGTKTVQLLLEGEYGGYFVAGEHYIPVRRDLGNLDEALDAFADQATRDRIADAAHRVVLERLTWNRLLDMLYDALAALLA